MKKGFSLFELVVVLLIVGILFSLPRITFFPDPHKEAVSQITQALRYARFLALIDQKNDATEDWSQTWWRVMLHNDNSGNKHQVLSVWSNKNRSGSLPATNEVAQDPYTKLLMSGNSQFQGKSSSQNLPSYDLTQAYGVDVSFKGTQCQDKKSIYFDHLGRPYSGTGSLSNPYSDILTTECTLVVKSLKTAQTSSITVFPFSGKVEN